MPCSGLRCQRAHLAVRLQISPCGAWYYSSRRRRHVLQEGESARARFFKSDCERADFSGADLTGASFESANLKDAILANAKAEGTAFSQTILDAKSFDGADFTEAVRTAYVQKALQAGDGRHGRRLLSVITNQTR